VPVSNFSAIAKLLNTLEFLNAHYSLYSITRDMTFTTGLTCRPTCIVATLIEGVRVSNHVSQGQTDDYIHALVNYN